MAQPAARTAAGPERAARERQYQKRFRARFVAGTPAWDHGGLHLGFLQTRNFDLAFPICDAPFGTSDRGLLGTLFDGESTGHVRRDLAAGTPPADVGAATEAGPSGA